MPPVKSLRNYVLMKQQMLLQDAQIREITKNKEHYAQKLGEQEQQKQRLCEYANNENENLYQNLYQNLSETAIELKNKEAGLLQCDSSWPERHTSLKNKYIQAVNEQRSKTKVTPGHTTARHFEDEKREVVNYYSKYVAKREYSAVQTYEHMRRDIERLCQMLSETNKQLKQAQGEKIELEDKFAKELAANDQTWEKLLIKYQQDLFQAEEQVDQKKTEVLNLTSKGGELLLTEATWQKRFNEWKDNKEQQQMESHKLSEANNQLNKAELPQSDTLCHEKYDSQIQLMETKLTQMEAERKELEDKFAKELAANDQIWEKLLKKYQQDLFQSEEQVDQKKTEVLNLSKEKEGLWQELKETTGQLTSKGDELLLTEATWQKRFNELKDNEKQHQMESDKQVNRLKQEIQDLRVSEIQDLSKKNDSLSLMLTETTSQLRSKEVELSQSDRAWQDKYNALEDRMTRALAERDQSLESLTLKNKKTMSMVEELLQLCKDKDTISQKLRETSFELSSRGDKLQKKYNALADQLTLTASTKQEEQTEKKEKKKKKGFFSRFHKKVTCAGDTRVIEEAACCSAQAGQQ
ncbi:interaptin-like [Sebastes umbrosus]|uniref:interaptin-like n=1 Tax=Sebastes umbrosus TaxID=72105 RepID=UPI00189F603F|nr:interaptin-like [Sebastes umbrosus]